LTNIKFQRTFTLANLIKSGFKLQVQMVEITLNVPHLKTGKHIFGFSLGESLCRTSQRQHC
jgi:hypothetical protein